MRIAVADLFWSKVDKSPGHGPAGECWVWIGGAHNQGYGVFPRSGVHYAHRAAWLLTFGKIPSGKCVLHSCDNPPCVNPAHLWIGTQTDNMRDRDRKGRTSAGARHAEACRPALIARFPNGKRTVPN